MNQPILQIKNLSIDFKSEKNVFSAVQNVSIEVSKGEIVAIVGESGSGKSVSSLAVLQLLPKPAAQYRGEILFFEDDQCTDLLKLNSSQMQAIRGNKIAMIFQEPMTSLNPVYTCGNQVMEAIRLHQKISSAEAKKKVVELFEKVKLPNASELYNRYPHQLSGGQKQRVMIAMAMSCKPSVLIADEPTTALDVTVQKTILQLIKDLQKQENMGVIFITHDLGVVSEIADKVVVMYKGKIVEQGFAKNIFKKPQHPYTKGLLACRPSLHNRGERLPVVSDFMEVDENGNIIEKIYEEIKLSDNNDTSRPFESYTNKIVEVKNLEVYFASRKNFLGKATAFTKAIDNVNFVIYEGETLGLVGESGCGKTTLGRTLLRLIEPTKGSILFNGKNLSTYSKQEMKILRKDIQIIFQDPYSSLNPRLTIGSAISEPLAVHDIIKNKNQRKDRVIELLEKVNLKAEHFNRYPHEFSGGQRQRICIARALALNPSFIVCDESVSALDVSVQSQVLNLLNDLKKEFKFTAVFISHDLAVVRYISDRIIVMNKGKIEEEGSSDSIYENPQTEYTKKLIASIPKIEL